MLTYLYHALASFRNALSRERSGLLFRAVVLSFLAANNASIPKKTASSRRSEPCFMAPRRNRPTRHRSSESFLKSIC